MEKPYIKTTTKFNAITYCSMPHKISSAIVHITDYEQPPLELYKHDWCRVRGILHLGFNNTENQEDSFNKELADKTAKFITDMIKRRVEQIYIFCHPKDKVQAKNVGLAIVNYMRDSNIQIRTVEYQNNTIYNLMFEAMKNLNVPKYDKKTKITNCN